MYNTNYKKGVNTLPNESSLDNLVKQYRKPAKTDTTYFENFLTSARTDLEKSRITYCFNLEQVKELLKEFDLNVEKMEDNMYVLFKK